MISNSFQLEIFNNRETCAFYLFWNNHRRWSAKVAYPETVIQSYRAWQHVYLQYYRNRRGVVEVSGKGRLADVDLASQLEMKRAALIAQFNQWLGDGALTEMREAIAKTARQSLHKNSPQSAIDLFVACETIDLARLPWEAWNFVTQLQEDKELQGDKKAVSLIRLMRTRLNQNMPVSPPLQQRQKARILIIVGKDEVGGLNFEQDLTTIQQKLAKIAVIERVGWEAGKTIPDLKKDIARAIAHPSGWDALFFAGHSNETPLTGGALGIAPNASMQLEEIRRELTLAIERGLQFAFFNSCNGLTIADSLINAGLSQIAIMREPISNTVAQTVLVNFLECLKNHCDVQDALHQACQFLETSIDKRFEFPSAYLVPSLYCKPQTALFHIPRKGWKRWLKPWQPTRSEAIAITSLLSLTLAFSVPPIADPKSLKSPLLEQRIWSQAVYRDFTNQKTDNNPPILLVDIDEQSVQPAQRNPIDRHYLAQIIRRLTELDAKVIGLDYLLDGSQAGDDELAQAVHQAVQKNQTWFVFAAEEKENEFLTANSNFAARQWSLNASMNTYPQYMRLPDQGVDCYPPKMAYLLALVQQINQSASPARPQPNLQSQTDLCEQVFQFTQQSTSQNETLFFLNQIQNPLILNFIQVLPPVTDLWLTPIKDFSIPPDYVYQRISARRLLDQSLDAELRKQGIKQKIVLIAGSYWGGIDRHKDNFAVPAAIAYRTQAHQWFTGAESHAYGIHHFLSRRLIVPIPDLWMVGVAIILGKGMTIFLYPLLRDKHRGVIAGTSMGILVYVLVSFQLYNTGAILIPCCLPIATYLIYLLPILTKKLYV